MTGTTRSGVCLCGRPFVPDHFDAEGQFVFCQPLLQRALQVDIPAVCYIDDLCRHLRLSRSTVKRLRRHGSFPIRELPSLDKHPRWAGEDVRRFLANQRTPLRRVG